MWKVRSLFNLILPESCPVCKNTSDNIKTSPFCSSCWGIIKSYNKKRRCQRCGIILNTSYDSTCLLCIKNPPFYEKMYVFGDYEGVLKESIHYMKFQSRKNLAKELGKLLTTLEIPDVDLILPVPLSKKRLIERGFNQSYYLAKRVSEAASIPVVDDFLLKTRDTLPQSLLSREERLKNQKGSFCVNPLYKTMPHKVALVDDVVTTSATVNECARILKKAGIKEVYIIVLARALPD